MEVGASWQFVPKLEIGNGAPVKALYQYGESPQLTRQGLIHTIRSTSRIFSSSRLAETGTWVLSC